MTPLERLPHPASLQTAIIVFVAIVCLHSRQRPSRSRPNVNDKEIRPFRVNVPEEALDDLRRRVLATRWPDKETVSDRSQGVQLANLQALVRYWGTDYDWRKAEAKLNALPQFITTIDGLDIHFIHVRSRHPNALPVIITHGWPGSIIEQLKIIGPLTDPTAHGGRAQDAFDVVIPSMPGYGFSGKPTATGWNPDRIARAWAELMTRLGYTRYVAQGGDWGSPDFERDGAPGAGRIARHPHQLAGNGTARCRRGARRRRACAGRPLREGTGGVRLARHVLQEAQGLRRHDGYAAASDRPGLDGLSSGPCGLHVRLQRRRARAPADQRRLPGQRHAVLADEHCHLAARLYWETGGQSVLLAAAQKTSEISLPVAITVFPDEVYRAPETWARRAYRNLIYFKEVDKGGHFAAWEQPELFAAELRAAFRSLRSTN